MKISRMDLLWILGIAGAVVTYLTQQPVPTEWGYQGWLAFAAFAVSTLLAWLRTPGREAWTEAEREANQKKP